MDAGGLTIAANALSPGGATLTDDAGNAADTSLGTHAISDDGRHRG